MAWCLVCGNDVREGAAYCSTQCRRDAERIVERDMLHYARIAEHIALESVDITARRSGTETRRR